MSKAVSCAFRLFGRAGWSGALLALAALLAAPVSGQTPPAQSVAIYYDGPSQPLAEGFLDSAQIQNLLGHFGLRGESFRIEDYRPGHLLAYRAAFFVGTATGSKIPEAFLADVRRSTQPFCWIGRHADVLIRSAEDRQRFGFVPLDYRDDLEFRTVVYKGVSLPKEDPDITIVSVSDPAKVQVLATAVNDEKQSRPYALRSGKFWYFADTPFSYVQEGDRYLVFCDLLHDILEIDHARQAQALVRIEDVSADSDPADLGGLTDLLSTYRTPFQVAVIPIFRDPARSIEVRLSDRPAIVEAIQNMIARGGAPILHGVTHQFRGVSADDYEFWDALNNRPVPGDSADVVRRKLGDGLREMFASDIFPVAFETPHYAASEAGYDAMKSVFSLFYERTMATPDIGAIQFYPYATTDRFGRRVVPENLGYLEADDPQPQTIIRRARNLLVVRDAVASFYFHSFMDRALLGEILRGISGLGYRFISIRSFSNEVNYQGRYAVRSSSGSVRMSLNGEYWRARQYDGAGKLIAERFAGSRQTGEVSVPVEAPPGGWAVVSTSRELRQQAAPGVLSRLRRWWDSEVAGLSPGASTKRTAAARAWILWLNGAAGESAHNQESYRTVLEAFGLQVKRVPVEEFAATPSELDTLLVVPEAAGKLLGSTKENALLNYLSRGGLVLADGRQEWIARLGYSWTGWKTPVAAVTDVLFPEMQLRWQPEASVDRFNIPEGAQVFLLDSASKQTLALSGTHGSGRYVYLAAPLDPHSSTGVSRYPYLFEYLTEGLRLERPQSAPKLEVYFDPSYREGVGLDRLAAAWRRAGVRAIYAAAWKFYRTGSYDYAQLIQACHRNGISVYAWFIFPAVTPKMWDEHPEWRERNAAGTQDSPGWRPLLNFENPACFRAAVDWMQTLLKAHDWDGVNVTELNYDADFTDYLRADRFVPMNDEVRASFRGRAGFDPAELFQPASPRFHKRDPKALSQFLRYRQELVTAWHRRVLGELQPLARSRGWEVIVTMLDSLHSDFVGPALGVDSASIVALMKQFDFTLQVEDHAAYWRQSPDRYRRFAERYLPLVSDRRRLMFDINVVPDRSVDGTTFPSARATGTELALTVQAAASASGRVAIYSEHTVASQDWGLLGTALARTARAQGGGPEWRIDSPVAVRLVSYQDRDAYLNGQPWPVTSPEGVTAPPGRHQLTFNRPWIRWLDRGEKPARLLHVNADLLEGGATPTGISARYSSPGRAVLLLDRRPLAILLDGAGYEAKVEESGGRWSLVVPGGEHVVRVETATRAGILVGVWSYLSSSAIATFGAVASVLMIAIYFRLRWRRRERRGVTV